MRPGRVRCQSTHKAVSERTECRRVKGTRSCWVRSFFSDSKSYLWGPCDLRKTKFLLGWMRVRVVASWIWNKHHRPLNPSGIQNCLCSVLNYYLKSQAHCASARPSHPHPQKMPLANKMRHPDALQLFLHSTKVS